MANTPENPSSPPKEITPTPSITTSTTPLSKKGKTKMLACKTVAGSALSKKLDKQLKDSQFQESQKSDDSFKSATEGEEIVSSETEHVSSGPKSTSEIISEVDTNLKNRFMLVGSIAGVKTTESGEVGGGSGSGEAAEGLVQLGKNRDKSISSEQETLADLLRRVIESYNPKKKGSSKAKTPSTASANKKSKAAPSVTIEIPPTRGRAIRSQLKQNEAELQKALGESRRKTVAKGKKKVDEHVKAIDIDEMDLVLRDEDETEEVEVLTPKAKKSKTSTKKFVSESNFVEPSTLVKRTRSAVKSKQVKNVEEKEWSGEEENYSDTEKDNMAKFGKRTILKGRLLRTWRSKEWCCF
uniref:Uncharacterized protein n=1 Tax=Nicotiana tabacum TaxID=4097 RepID=A0A1S3XHU9_TOBAC|nr:PREDICTED: uncharacterized protein LOC107765418 [Nicotiana tabacum]